MIISACIHRPRACGSRQSKAPNTATELAVCRLRLGTFATTVLSSASAAKARNTAPAHWPAVSVKIREMTPGAVAHPAEQPR